MDGAVPLRADFTGARLVSSRQTQAPRASPRTLLGQWRIPMLLVKQRRQTEEPRCHMEETTGWR
jgi:hypothetical protein